MVICGNCIGDPGFNLNQIRRASHGRGTCVKCKSKHQNLIYPNQLKEHFEILLSAYKIHSNGRPLLTWFREDWNLFPEERLRDAEAREILAEIFDDGNIVRNNFSPIQVSCTNFTDDWKRLRSELMYDNRFFPGNKLDVDVLKSLFEYLIILEDDIPLTFFRARIENGSGKFRPSEMGAPKPEATKNGRANPPGVPYLYVASDKDTAIAEIRPHNGDTVSVANLWMEPNLKIADLRDPRKTISPFLFDEGQLPRLRFEIGLMERLGRELARPIPPRNALIDYVPSQYLCELIKSLGYDGVAYNSSSEKGANFAFFNPAAAKIKKVKSYKISKLEVVSSVA